MRVRNVITTLMACLAPLTASCTEPLGPPPSTQATASALGLRIVVRGKDEKRAMSPEDLAEVERAFVRSGYRVVKPTEPHDLVADAVIAKKASDSMLEKASLTLTAPSGVVAASDFDADGNCGNKFGCSVARTFTILVNGINESRALAQFGEQKNAGQRVASNVPPSSAPPAAPAPPPSTDAPAAKAALGEAPSAAFDVVSATPQAGAVALVIGVESYRSLPSPTGARADAARIAAVMKKTFGVTSERLRVLTDAQATRADVLAGLEWLKSTVKPGGRVYFYFSGHGSPEPSTGTAYVLPYESSADNLTHSGIKLDDVVAALAQTSAHDAIALIDTCFSGMGDRSVLAPGVRPLSRVKEVAPPSKVVLFTATGAQETSGPATGEPVGAFTKFLAEGLGKGHADVNGDGQITMQELVDWVSPRVTRDALAQQRKQTPRLVVGGTNVGTAHQLVVGYGYR